MRKILTIARREYLAMVATKAFLISIAIMPIFMFGSLLFTTMSENFSTEKDKEIAICDSTGELFPQLQAAAETYNKALDELADEDEGKRPHITLRQLDSKQLSDRRRLELSDEVRDQKISAFVEIPANVLDDETDAAVLYYSVEPPFSTSRRWLDRTLNELIRVRRLKQAGIDPDIVQRASIPIAVKGMQLFNQSETGDIESGEEKDAIVALMIPFGMMMSMFMIVMLTAQPMLESVLEEKTERIAEVLLGAANPFQIMAGKLLGNVAGSLSILVIYLIGGYALVSSQGWQEMIPMNVLPWFAAFQILAVLFFSSLFMCVGASVHQLKEAQGMLMPILLTMVIPMFVWMPTLREPNGIVATTISFFPPATPMMMVLRLSTDTPIPLWQTILALSTMIVSTIVIVFMASRIFRVAILWQGKTPKITELVRWALTNN